METVTLRTVLDQYLERRTDVKEITKIKWRQTCNALKEFFGADKPLASITVGEARDFERGLTQMRKSRYRDADKKTALAGNTVRKRVHDHFVKREEAERILAACRSEHLALRWSDIDWTRNRMEIRSPKTEHHDGKDCRAVPLFPELRHLERILRRAGLHPGPKLRQNLRSPRATELAAEQPAHVAASRLGLSTVVAPKHYRQATDSDLAKVVGEETAGTAAEITVATARREEPQTAAATLTNAAVNCRISQVAASEMPPPGLERGDAKCRQRNGI
jgi:integrase